MKKKNYVGKAVMLGALLAPIGLPTVSVLADGFYQNQTSAHAADIIPLLCSVFQLVHVFRLQVLQLLQRSCLARSQRQ